MGSVPGIGASTSYTDGCGSPAPNATIVCRVPVGDGRRAGSGNADDTGPGTSAMNQRCDSRPTSLNVAEPLSDETYATCRAETATNSIVATAVSGMEFLRRATNASVASTT